MNIFLFSNIFIIKNILLDLLSTFLFILKLEKLKTNHIEFGRSFILNHTYDAVHLLLLRNMERSHLLDIQNYFKYMRVRLSSGSCASSIALVQAWDVSIVSTKCLRSIQGSSGLGFRCLYLVSMVLVPSVYSACTQHLCCIYLVFMVH